MDLANEGTEPHHDGYWHSSVLEFRLLCNPHSYMALLFNIPWLHVWICYEMLASCCNSRNIVVV